MPRLELGRIARSATSPPPLLTLPPAPTTFFPAGQVAAAELEADELKLLAWVTTSRPASGLAQIP